MNRTFNNMFDRNILSLVNSSILLPDHSHPVLYCLSVDRAQKGKKWLCDKCKNKNSFNVPSFFCVFCDFDLCRKCVDEIPLKNIVIYDYNTKLFDNTKNNPLLFYEWKSFFSCHKHLLGLIKKVNNLCYWICSTCNQSYSNMVFFYYCSLCDFYLCQKCAVKENQKNNE